MRKILSLAVFYCMCLLAQAQNFVGEEILFSPDTLDNGGFFGNAIAIQDNVAVIGAVGESDEGDLRGFGRGAGATYLFEKDADGNWDIIQKLTASDGVGGSEERPFGDAFGMSVAMSGNFIAIGATNEGDTVTEASGGVSEITGGAVYVFRKDETTGQWNEMQKLRAIDRESGDEFGRNVTITGNQIIVSAPFKRIFDRSTIIPTFTVQGSVYVFELDASETSWSQVQAIRQPRNQEVNLFGQAISAEGDVLIIGEPIENQDENNANELTNAGAAFIYQRNTNTGQWAETQKILASDRRENGRFGSSLSISGDYILIGSLNSVVNDPETFINAGSVAYIFKRNAVNEWEEEQILSPSGDELAGFGNVVALEENLALVSGSDPQGVRVAYTFTKNNDDIWVQSQRLENIVEFSSDLSLGFSLGLSETDIMIGQPERPDNATGLLSVGGVQVYQNSPILQYAGDGFIEDVVNDGSLIGAINLSIVLDTFAISGGALSTDNFTINNLPEGLTPVLIVDASGLTATLTMNGNANNSQSIDDLGNLEFTFEDTAFRSGNATNVTNAINGNSNLGITYVDGLPIILSDTIVFVNENTEGGLLLDISSLNGDSEITDQNVTYAIANGGDNDFFTIDTTTGELSSISIFNFENPSDQNVDNDYILNITVNDGTNNVSQEFNIRIIDEDEFPEFFGNNQLLINENITGIIQDIMATDGDAGAEDENLTYSIAERFDHEFFSISATTGEVSLTRSLDFETPQDAGQDNIYVIEVNVSDGVNTNFLNYEYTVDDVNELPMLEDRSITINENSIVGSVVLEASALLADPEDDVLTYGISDGNEGGTFIINSLTGELSINEAALLDFETQNDPFALNIAVTDEELTGSFNVTVTLRDIDEPVTISDQVFTIDENPTNNSLVGQVIAFDPDVNSDIRFFIIAGNNNNTFAMTENGELSINDSTLVDFEVNPSLTLTVQTSSSGFNAAADISININDLVENSDPTDIMLSSNLVNEGLPAETIFATLSTVDSDVGDSHSYTLSGTNANQFLIVGNELQTASIFNFITDQSFIITINTNDGNGGDFSKDFTINVNGNPIITESFQDLIFTEGFASEVISISGVVSDPNQDEFTLTITSENEQVVRASISNDELTIEEVGIGESILTISATDVNGGIVSVSFSVTVEAIVTSISNLTNDGILKTYPNPIDDVLLVEIPFIDISNIELEVIDLSGKRYELEKASINGKYQIDTQSLVSGIYVLKVKFLDQVMTKKIIKSK